MTNQKANKGTRIVLIFFIIIILPVIWFVFLNKDSDMEIASDTLKGNWYRTDGSYTLEFSLIKEEGRMVARYFNPSPINVGRSEWRMNDEILEVYVELDDRNYPGSTYSLTYDKKSKELSGTYFQAVSRETFPVKFLKKKDK